jgi:hypothetical protein
VRKVVACVLIAVALTAGTAASASSTQHRTDVQKVQYIIRYVFGRYGYQAVAVARCETGGTFWPGSHNGQYLGIFQMGSHERATYGHSPTAWGQAIAAYKYFVASHYTWRAWSCKP